MQLKSHPLTPDIAEDRSSLLIASPDIMTPVHCSYKLLSLVTSYQGNSVHTSESCKDKSGLFVTKCILSQAIITVIRLEKDHAPV